jgi:hypothetical protein
MNPRVIPLKYSETAFATNGHVQVHMSERDFGVAFRMKRSVNPLERGHIAFRTDNLAAFKKRLEENGVPYSDYGKWAMNGWHQIFFQDPDGNVVEVHLADALRRSLRSRAKKPCMRIGYLGVGKMGQPMAGNRRSAATGRTFTRKAVAELTTHR